MVQKFTLAILVTIRSDRAIDTALRIVANNHASNLNNVFCGVPMRTILVPLLFIIYVYELHR